MGLDTPEQLIDAIRASGLLTSAQLQEASKLASSSPDMKAVAVSLVRKGILSRWQVNQIVVGKYPRELNKYKLIDQLAAGESGTVYLAEHSRMERRVILKTLTRQPDDEAEPVQRFLADARKLATLDHRNIPHVYDVDREGDEFRLVMEYIEGEDFQEIVEREGAMSCHAAASYTALAADALAHAHKQGIEHHNIKPDRLLLDKKGELKLLDIGIARLVDPDQEETDASQYKNPADVDYLAPEQATGKNKVDYRADIYSLGCTFFFLMTGRPPYSGSTIEERLQARLRKSPVSVTKYRRDAPPGLVNICGRMMATQPRGRAKSAVEVAELLEQWLKDNPERVSVTPPPITKRPASDDKFEQPSAQDSETDAAEFKIRAADPLKERMGKRTASTGLIDELEQSERRDELASNKVVARQQKKRKPKEKESKKKKVSPATLYSAACGAVALLLAIVLAVVMLSGGSETEPTDSQDETTLAVAEKEDAPIAGGENVIEPLIAQSVTGPDGKKCTAQDGGWYSLATSDVRSVGTYKFVATSSLPRITGFRVEWQRDQDAKSSAFELNEFEVFADSSRRLDATHRLAISAADSEPPLDSSPAVRSIDLNLGTTCSIPMDAEKAQAVRYRLADPITKASVGNGDAYRLQLVFHTSSPSVAGRFRVIAETEAMPFEDRSIAGLAAHRDVKSLAYWRFEKGAPEAFATNVQKQGSPAAAGDVSENGNALYCLTAAVAPKWTDDVPAAEVRDGETSGRNTVALNDSLQPPPGQTGRYLVTNSVLAKPNIDLAGYPLDEWTIEASFKLAALDGVQAIVSKNGRPTASSDLPLQLRFDGTTGQIVIAAIDREGKLRTAETPTEYALAVDQWVHAAAVCDGKRLKLYVDTLDEKGYQEQADVEFSGGLIQSFGDWTVGAGLQNDKPVDDALAVIDEVRISAVALQPKDFLFADEPTVVASTEQIDEEQPGPVDDGGSFEFHALPIDKADAKLVSISYQSTADGFYRINGNTTSVRTVNIMARTDLNDIVGLRLELRPPVAVGTGVDGHEDLYLADINCSYTKPDGGSRKYVKFSAATADTLQADNPIANIMDDSRSTAWQVGSRQEKDRWAVMAAKEPFGDGNPIVLTIELRHRKNTISHFRLSAITGSGTIQQMAAALRTEQLSAKPFIKMSPQALPALPTADSPAPDFTDLCPLGSVYFSNVEDFQPSLVGGDGGHGVKGTFDLQPSEVSAETKQWDFRFTSAEGGTATSIARLSLVKNDLSIYWLDAAVEIAGADHLRNCWLNLTVGEKSTGFALRYSIDVQPIAFSLSKGRRERSGVSLTSPPSDDRLRVEVQLPADVFGDYTFDPAGPLAINGGKATAKLGGQQALTLRVTTNWNSPELELEPQLLFRPDPESEKEKAFTLRAVQSNLTAVLRMLEPAKAQLAGLEKKLVYEGRERFKQEEKIERDRLLRRFPNLTGEKLEAAIERGKAFVAQNAKVADRYTELFDQAKRFQAPASESGAYIELRVFMTLGDSEVDLVRTTAWSSE